jgi:DNA-binding transcriptional LysR family regulator
MPMPAWPVGNADVAKKIKNLGFENCLGEVTLFRDHDDSNAWSNWFEAAGVRFQKQSDSLIIPDPNVRVQAVIDGQGVALVDALTASELERGQLVRLSDVELSSYGYFLVRPFSKLKHKPVEDMIGWLQEQLSVR